MAFTGSIGHLEGIESPWGNAGGVIKTLDDVEVMARTGVGWIEAGSYTLEPRLGNAWNPEAEAFDRTVYYHDASTGETFNSLGMPNKGMDVVEREIPGMIAIAHALGKPLIINVAPTSHEPVAESVELVRRAYSAGADAVLLNAGCPNVVMPDGGRHELLSRSSEGFWKVLHGLYQADLPKPVFVRISPMENQTQMQLAADSIKNSGVVSAVLTPNTWPGHNPVNDRGESILQVSGGLGGRSGPATSGESEQQLALARHYLKDTGVDLVSSGGMMTSERLRIRLAMGAVAGCGTTFFYESQNGWAEDVDRLLNEFAGGYAHS